MADTKRTRSALQTLLADNITGDISAQDARDVLVSTYGTLKSKTIVLIDTPYFMTADDCAIYADATSGDITINLLETGADDALLLIQKTDSSVNTVTINRSGSDTIDGGTSIILTRQRGLIFLHKQGTAWSIVGDQRYDKTTQNNRINQLLGTGLISGGIITVNGGDNTKFDISAGTGIVMDESDPEAPTETLVSWSAFTAQTLPDLATADITRVAINDAGSVIKSTSPFTPVQERDYIILGGLIHASRTQIDGVSVSPRVIYNVMGQFNDFAEAVGPLNIDGNVYGPNGANLKIDRNAGSTFRLGTGFVDDIHVPNIHTDNPDTDVQPLVYTYRSASPPAWTNSVKSAIDPEYYDDGSGTPAAVTAGYWTIQTIYFSCAPAATYIQYGQVLYANKSAALSALNTAISVNPALVQTTFRAWLVVQQGTTVLNSTTYAEFVPASKFGSLSGGGGGATGEVNTASNQGNAGYGPFYQKLGVDLQFKNIAANSTKIAVTDDTVGHNIKIDVAEGNVAHQNLSGAGTNAHSAIDSHIASTSNPHSVTKAQVGLTNVTDDAQIAKSIGTTKGDVISFTASATPARLAVGGANGQVLNVDSAQSTGLKYSMLGTSSVFPQYRMLADMLDTPNNADWAVNARAPLAVDSLNNAMRVRLFDDTAVEGVGASFEIPTGATNIIIETRSRAITAPGTARVVIPKLYFREVGDNAAVTSWSGGLALTGIDIPITNAYFQLDTQTIALSTLGATAGRLIQIEYCRNGADGSDTLVGDWALLHLDVYFS